jgi:hypothetical protein
MIRKAASKKKPAKKKSAKPKPVAASVVVRELPSEVTNYTEPTTVYANKQAATARAKALNAELRAVTNPFEGCSAEYMVKGGEKALLALLKEIGAPAPAKPKPSYPYIDWEKWWDGAYFDMTDAQRDAIWDALDKFDWYEVKTVTVE